MAVDTLNLIPARPAHFCYLLIRETSQNPLRDHKVAKAVRDDLSFFVVLDLSQLHQPMPVIEDQAI